MIHYNELAFAYGKPGAIGSIKAFPEDFKVDEILGFELTGEGEHECLLIEKKGLNTEELVKAVARSINYPVKDISYAGIKDRQAVSTQWLSIHCPGTAIPEIHTLKGQGWRVIANKRHLKKLKKGVLAGNSFQLTIRNIQGMEEIEHRLQQIKQQGVPNYFGSQRFGIEEQNLIKAERLLLGDFKVKNRFLRGIYYSAARSFLFNLIVSKRIHHCSWNVALPGDVMQLGGKNSIFTLDRPDEVIQKRVQSFDISPAAVLWGIGKELVTDTALAIQQEALESFESWCKALEKHKLERSFRAQVLRVNDLSWERQDEILLLNFTLRAGSYATSVVRELLSLT